MTAKTITYYAQNAYGNRNLYIHPDYPREAKLIGSLLKKKTIDLFDMNQLTSISNNTIYFKEVLPPR